MTIYILFLLFISAIVVLFLFKNQNREKSDFDLKQNLLEQKIADENAKINKQKQKIKIVEDFKKTIKSNNEELFSQIAGMNNSLFEEINRKNKSNS